MSEPAAKKQKMDFALAEKTINTIRMVSADQPQAANSGHPGAPMGMAPMAYALWTQVMRFSPAHPKWINRDRFVLSNGHSCALQYTMLHLTGYERPTLNDLKQFRQLHSVTPGHPENHLLEGVEVSTGPLGSGISNAVGLALAQEHMAAHFNEPGLEIFDNYTFVFCGDGCMQEGIASEACSFAGHQKLGRLIVLYDDNKITIDGATDKAFTEDVLARFEAYGWHTQTISNGDKSDVSEVMQAIEEAKKVTDKPSFIKVRTTIGYMSKKQGTGDVHGAPLGSEEISRLRKEFGLDAEPFSVADDVREHLLAMREKGAATKAKWDKVFQEWSTKAPEKAAELQRRLEGKLPDGWDATLPAFTPQDKPDATRNCSGKVLNALCKAVPEIIGGSADLTGSNKTKLNDDVPHNGSIQPDSRGGRYIYFGVREHAMAAICNGISAYGGLIPFGATFLVFASYAMGSIRLSALSNFQVLYIMTHDSIGVGEDGPTHQQIEILMALRAMPNMFVFRPCDGNEVSGSYKEALQIKDAPSTLVFSRQNLPQLPNTSIEGVARGAYVIYGADEQAPDVTLVGTGSEVHVLVEASDELAKKNIKATVVSMPCWELFEKQPVDYQKTCFLQGVPVISLEASATLGWARYSHAQMGLDSFGMSAPQEKLFEHFNLRPANVVAKAEQLLRKFPNRSAPWLADLATVQ